MYHSFPAVVACRLVIGVEVLSLEGTYLSTGFQVVSPDAGNGLHLAQFIQTIGFALASHSNFSIAAIAQSE
jgi:hypothetical protein